MLKLYYDRRNRKRFLLLVFVVGVKVEVIGGGDTSWLESAFAIMREFKTGGSWSSKAWLCDDGAQSREMKRQRLRALNWRCGEYAQFRAREQASWRRAEIAWSDIVWGWLQCRARETTSLRTHAALGVRHWRVTTTSIDMGSEAER